MNKSINDTINIDFGLKYQSSKRMKIPHQIRQYHLQKLIIETQKCVVVASIHPETQKKVAIKCIPMKSFINNQKEDDIMRKIDHALIIKHLDSFKFPDQNPRFFAIVMPRGVSDLLDYHKDLSEKTVCKIMKDSLTAVNYLHSLRICHRDLKLDNILIMEETREGPSVALTDFGLSEEFAEDGTFEGYGTGTTEYSAPEILEIRNGKLLYKDNIKCFY